MDLTLDLCLVVCLHILFNCCILGTIKRTPKRNACEILAKCPPAPRKKQVYLKQRDPPENGYFHPPDLEMFFAMGPRRETSV
ncbi:hypothetical protein QVD17_31334 [Tagetes erecta]|uniref:Secreted protein n=1 Tax=Tagetes erecta TaxID=13708 RepID=A0AAD8K617_TARER|nr:hypothetical protein QVD17_31334 [Tagetes erecta]